ncbi:hypothetical protein Corgl_1127 [Coriobacterium glomerans PW2]|uniref:DUF2304 domain-containing protein n=1 Tax=Coriobacterium glomerans (strain ATCC 49209 / DSM 20642 / JCM 10262 / PW2) TaxID=700015 RepID=F2N850_CORGP|nr:DUF2304 domain-containing protein [Coriobacterium glomerans]AEB07233.1 hypothetical protein Corgl_1127 [Coriobacterium glomerans PW2]
MPVGSQIAIAIVCLVLLVYVLHLVKHERLQLRYSLLWLMLTTLTLLCAIFPKPLFSMSTFFGFETASNFIYFVGLLFSLVIMLSLSSIVSKQSTSIKNLAQRVALLEHNLTKK